MGHPAHYHNVKHSINILLQKGNEVKVVARSKDVLFDLLSEQNWDVVRLQERKQQGKLGLALSVLGREWKILRLAQKWKPDLMAGTDLVITHIGSLLKIPSIVINEDDSAAVPLMAKYAFPYATALLAPDCCDQSPCNDKKIGYQGYHELAYLHPDVFHPNRALLPDNIVQEKPYFLLRFASLNAHHDEGRSGITDELALALIEILKPHGQVYITSERPFGNQLEAYRLPVHPKDIHQVMAHAKIYIGDSQTMAAEAAVLGIPSIRFNDFVGELAYLEELEHRYGLTKGIKTHQKLELLEVVKKWVELKSLNDDWKMKQRTMLDNTISVTPFWVEIFEKLAAKS
jgi:predicted glycosyltransferase